MLKRWNCADEGRIAGFKSMSRGEMRSVRAAAGRVPPDSMTTVIQIFHSSRSRSIPREPFHVHFSSLPLSSLVPSSITMWNSPSCTWASNYFSCAVGGLSGHFNYIDIKWFWCRVLPHIGHTVVSILRNAKFRSRSILVAVNSTRVTAPVWQSDLGMVSECLSPSPSCLCG